MSAPALPPGNGHDPDADRARQQRQKAFLGLLSQLRAGEVARHREQMELIAKAEEVATSGHTSSVALEMDFVRLWEAKTHDTYTPNHARDRRELKRISGTLTAAEIRLRMTRYFASTEDYVQRARWPLALFCQQINTLGASGGSSAVQHVNTLLEEGGWFGER